ncbi:MAG: phosphate ABC transporter substrate-binding protein [Eubacterium sp.]|jgi:phosphate transport system substrate-binding protein|nr:phosphate ABC transporter substrate-binding protein [Eubacterium sp.]MCH4047670.1 phosphate ABC transporter substrate-binding protein [Eubacterium sp.]MCH4109586.1 phosphate ABC transporter substrate-binding protein [Eubacterium sp.]MCI1405155.1 phosphate ABC transporter substrate-binding protein [Eubacterium sp.]MCI1475217.1 phosphate ABC transporter substrate-binding protein [Eubacterium sp.]
MLSGEKLKSHGKLKAAAILVLIVAIMMAFTACGSSSSSKKSSSSSSSKISASGSSALQPLAKQAADDYMKAHSGVSITVSGGGSGTGLKQVSEGSVDIGNSDVYADEKLDKTAASKLKDHKVALVTVAPVVNSKLGVKNLTTDQLIGIFTGKITNWKEVGGPNLKIMLVTRPDSSGTRALFEQYAMNGKDEASKSALETDDSGTLMETVEKNKGAIGYVALSYLTDTKKASAVSIDGVAPTLENTYNGKYNVWGYEHMYTKGDGSKTAQSFIKYLSGKSYVKNVEKMGYGAISKLTDKAAKNHDK